MSLMSPSPRSLARALLQAARSPRALPQLLACARDLGAEPGEDLEILEGLLRDGLLRDLP